MPMERTTVKPSIAINVSPHSGQERKLRELRAGMEEEGIPYIVVAGEGDATALAYQGALSSPLGVGVGIGRDAVSIHFHKLPPGEPLFVIENAAPAELRLVGYNAARLVKGTPFKIDQVEPAELPGILPDLEQLVARIVHQVLQEIQEGQGR